MSFSSGMRTVEQMDLHCELTGLKVLRSFSGKPEPACLKWLTLSYFQRLWSLCLIQAWQLHPAMVECIDIHVCSSGVDLRHSLKALAGQTLHSVMTRTRQCTLHLFNSVDSPCLNGICTITIIHGKKQDVSLSQNEDGEDVWCNLALHVVWTRHTNRWPFLPHKSRNQLSAQFSVLTTYNSLKKPWSCSWRWSKSWSTTLKKK